MWDYLDLELHRVSENDKTTSESIYRYLGEIPLSSTVRTESIGSTISLQFKCDRGESHVVITKDTPASIPANQHTILVCWAPPFPVPFRSEPSPNMEYLDLKHGVTSRKLSGPAETIRDALQTRGYRFYSPRVPSLPRRLLRKARKVAKGTQGRR